VAGLTRQGNLAAGKPAMEVAPFAGTASGVRRKGV
jgi:hypothetical protein